MPRWRPEAINMGEYSRVSPELLGRLGPFRDEALKQRIPAPDVERWIATAARPCATLSPDGDGPVVGHFGGPLLLPPDVPDPYYPFLASIDFAALPAAATDLPLPDDGRLLLFAYAQDEYGSGGGGQAMYVPPGASTEEREVRYESVRFDNGRADPEARVIVSQYPQGGLRLTINVSLPGYEGICPDYFCHTLYRDHPYAEELSAVWRDTQRQCAGGGPLVLGGYAEDENGGLEFTRKPYTGQDGNDWVLLADWHTAIRGVEGLTVHWPIRWPDLTARRFDQVDATVFWNP
jgi:Domain of unknown function (DUF1963)